MFSPTFIDSQPNASIPPSDSVAMTSHSPHGVIPFNSGGNDSHRDKNGKRPLSTHFPLPFTPSMTPIIYPTTTNGPNDKGEDNKPDMDKGKAVDDKETPQPEPFRMPDNRTAFLCPHGLHISDTIAVHDSGLSEGHSDYHYLQTRCLVCDVMREYHPYQPQTADPIVGEQWIRYMDYICGVRNDRIMGQVGAAGDVADRCVSLAGDLLAQQEKLLADIRKMSDAAVPHADDEDDEFVTDTSEALTEEKKEEKKKSFKKAVQTKIHVDEEAAKSDFSEDGISAAVRTAVERMAWMDDETLQMAFKHCIDDEKKKEIVLSPVIAERQRIADEKKIVDENNVLKKRHDRKKKQTGIMDTILKKRCEDAKKDAEDKRMAEVMNAFLDQSIADQKAEKIRVKKKAGKKKQAGISDTNDDNKPDPKESGENKPYVRKFPKPTGTVPRSGARTVIIAGNSGRKSIFEFGTRPSK
ncbi:hypothetical protein PENANT_c003G07924 [Penicillium antarcticum]|uniref:Uncharacterized protein n=1 Tax=Penicillium antarcticum TaxID=416450 RepID=A0A1V6QHT7_9EURO|nr:uncharacterized protein N7508_005733 [Penicillium antarcticum]KAJ5306718.1 hypothetical protein N7508_005733 [Penicillium antarcticum]OQD88788.1 hypothetical protein PENANT_c003G07924 [Penicillium antarcticum]